MGRSISCNYWCLFSGVKHFVEANSLDLNIEYTPSDIAALVAGHYGEQRFLAAMNSIPQNQL